jgi:hypothetical protein
VTITFYREVPISEVMQNKTLLLGLLLAFPLQSSAFNCDAKNASADLGKRGFIVYAVTEKVCVKDGEKETCFQHKEREGDYCQDAATVVKKSCNGAEPVSEEKTCPPNTKCLRGRCE